MIEGKSRLHVLAHQTLIIVPKKHNLDLVSEIVTFVDPRVASRRISWHG
jgi:hypothetical protein